MPFGIGSPWIRASETSNSATPASTRRAFPSAPRALDRADAHGVADRAAEVRDRHHGAHRKLVAVRHRFDAVRRGGSRSRPAGRRTTRAPPATASRTPGPWRAEPLRAPLASVGAGVGERLPVLGRDTAVGAWLARAARRDIHRSRVNQPATASRDEHEQTAESRDASHVIRSEAAPMRRSNTSGRQVPARSA